MHGRIRARCKGGRRCGAARPGGRAAAGMACGCAKRPSRKATCIRRRTMLSGGGWSGRRRGSGTGCAAGWSFRRATWNRAASPRRPFWRSGAAAARMRSRSRASTTYAYELAGQYAFSAEPDEERQEQLRERVRFLVEDAPSLQRLDQPLRADAGPRSRGPLSRHPGRAGRAPDAAGCLRQEPARTPVVQVDFGPGRGTLILSQLITRGRLAEGYGQAGLYGLRLDPAAEQFVLNMLAG